MSKLVEKLVLDLTKKVDQGFNRVGADIKNLEKVVTEHSFRLDNHSVADTSANKRVDQLEVRVVKLESRPQKILRLTGQTVIAFIGVVSTTLGIAWTLRNWLLQ